MEQYKFKENENLDVILNDFEILFAYHSNRIENPNTNYHDTREIFTNGKVVSYTGDLRTLFEISNQKDCFQYIVNSLLNHQPISINLIKQIHYELTKGTYDERRFLVNGEKPGEFKKHDYIVGVNEVGAPYDMVEEELIDLINEINSYPGNDYLTVVAYLHAMFESIHPFADGNGRVGRTLINYYLLSHQIKPLIIYDEDKKLYYECLEQFDTKNDINPLKEFLLYELEKTWRKKESTKHSLKTIVND